RDSRKGRRLPRPPPLDRLERRPRLLPRPGLHQLPRRRLRRRPRQPPHPGLHRPKIVSGTRYETRDEELGADNTSSRFWRLTASLRFPETPQTVGPEEFRMVSPNLDSGGSDEFRMVSPDLRISSGACGVFVRVPETGGRFRREG